MAAAELGGLGGLAVREQALVETHLEVQVEGQALGALDDRRAVGGVGDRHPAQKEVGVAVRERAETLPLYHRAPVGVEFGPAQLVAAEDGEQHPRGVLHQAAQPGVRLGALHRVLEVLLPP